MTRKFKILRGRLTHSQWVAWFNWRSANDMRYLTAVRTRQEEGRHQDDPAFHSLLRKAQTRVDLNNQLRQSGYLLTVPWRPLALNEIQESYLHKMVLDWRLDERLYCQWSHPKMRVTKHYIRQYIKARYYNETTITHNEAARIASDVVRQQSE